MQHKFHHLKCAWWLEPINNINTMLIEAAAAYIFSVVINFHIGLSAYARHITKHFWYKCHGLFDNSPVMTSVKNCLKFLSIH